MPDDRLDDRRRFVSGILFPLTAFGRRALDERTDLGEHAASKGELARVGIDLPNVSAVVPPTHRHTGKERSQRIVLRSHVGEPIVLPYVVVVFDDVVEHRRSAENGEHGSFGRFVDAGRKIAAFAVQIHVHVIEETLAQHPVRVLRWVSRSGAVWRGSTP